MEIFLDGAQHNSPPHSLGAGALPGSLHILTFVSLAGLVRGQQATVLVTVSTHSPSLFFLWEEERMNLVRYSQSVSI